MFRTVFEVVSLAIRVPSTGEGFKIGAKMVLAASNLIVDCRAAFIRQAITSSGLALRNACSNCSTASPTGDEVSALCVTGVHMNYTESPIPKGRDAKLV